MAYTPELQELELKLEKLHDLAVMWTEKRFPEASKTERRITILAAINAMIELEKLEFDRKKENADNQRMCAAVDAVRPLLEKLLSKEKEAPAPPHS